jgi:hypothetical protein
MRCSNDDFNGRHTHIYTYIYVYVRARKTSCSALHVPHVCATCVCVTVDRFGSGCWAFNTPRSCSRSHSLTHTLLVAVAAGWAAGASGACSTRLALGGTAGGGGDASARMVRAGGGSSWAQSVDDGCDGDRDCGDDGSGPAAVQICAEPARAAAHAAAVCSGDCTRHSRTRWNCCGRHGSAAELW